jgi:hypothetical protein
MTLTEHQKNVEKLIQECKDRGFDPNAVEIYTTHGASGNCNELSNGYLRVTNGNETAGPIIDLPKGTPFIDFYSGN